MSAFGLPLPSADADALYVWPLSAWYWIFARCELLSFAPVIRSRYCIQDQLIIQQLRIDSKLFKMQVCASSDPAGARGGLHALSEAFSQRGVARHLGHVGPAVRVSSGHMDNEDERQINHWVSGNELNEALKFKHQYLHNCSCL